MSDINNQNRSNRHRIYTNLQEYDDRPQNRNSIQKDKKSKKHHKQNNQQGSRSKSKTKGLQQFRVKKFNNRTIDKLVSLLGYTIQSADKAMQFVPLSTYVDANFQTRLYYSDRQNLLNWLNGLNESDLKSFKNLHQTTQQTKFDLIEDQYYTLTNSKTRTKSQSIHNYVNDIHISTINNDVFIDENRNSTQLNNKSIRKQKQIPNLFTRSTIAFNSNSQNTIQLNKNIQEDDQFQKQFEKSVRNQIQKLKYDLEELKKLKKRSKSIQNINFQQKISIIQSGCKQCEGKINKMQVSNNNNIHETTIIKITHQTENKFNNHSSKIKISSDQYEHYKHLLKLESQIQQIKQFLRQKASRLKYSSTDIFRQYFCQDSNNLTLLDKISKLLQELQKEQGFYTHQFTLLKQNLSEYERQIKQKDKLIQQLRKRIEKQNTQIQRSITNNIYVHTQASKQSQSQAYKSNTNTSRIETQLSVCKNNFKAFFNIVKNILMRSSGFKQKLDQKTINQLKDVQAKDGKVQKGMEILIRLLEQIVAQNNKLKIENESRLEVCNKSFTYIETRIQKTINTQILDDLQKSRNQVQSKTHHRKQAQLSLSELEKLQFQLQSKDKTILKLSQLLQIKQIQLEKIKIHIQKQEKHKNDAQKLIDNQSYTLEQLKYLLQDKTHQLSVIKQELQRKDQDIKQLQKYTHKLETHAVQIRQENSKLKDIEDEKNKQNFNLKQQKNSLLQYIQKLECKQKKYQQQLNDKQNELVQIKKMLQQYQESYQILEQRYYDEIQAKLQQYTENDKQNINKSVRHPNKQQKSHIIIKQTSSILSQGKIPPNLNVLLNEKDGQIMYLQDENKKLQQTLQNNLQLMLTFRNQCNDLQTQINTINQLNNKQKQQPNQSSKHPIQVVKKQRQIIEQRSQREQQSSKKTIPDENRATSYKSQYQLTSKYNDGQEKADQEVGFINQLQVNPIPVNVFLKKSQKPIQQQQLLKQVHRQQLPLKNIENKIAQTINCSNCLRLSQQLQKTLKQKRNLHHKLYELQQRLKQIQENQQQQSNLKDQRTQTYYRYHNWVNNQIERQNKCDHIFTTGDDIDKEDLNGKEEYRSRNKDQNIEYKVNVQQQQKPNGYIIQKSQQYKPIVEDNQFQPIIFNVEDNNQKFQPDIQKPDDEKQIKQQKQENTVFQPIIFRQDQKNQLIQENQLVQQNQHHQNNLNNQQNNQNNQQNELDQSNKTKIIPQLSQELNQQEEELKQQHQQQNKLITTQACKQQHQKDGQINTILQLKQLEFQQMIQKISTLQTKIKQLETQLQQTKKHVCHCTQKQQQNQASFQIETNNHININQYLKDTKHQSNNRPSTLLNDLQILGFKQNGSQSNPSVPSQRKSLQSHEQMDSSLLKRNRGDRRASYLVYQDSHSIMAGLGLDTDRSRRSLPMEEGVDHVGSFTDRTNKSLQNVIPLQQQQQENILTNQLDQNNTIKINLPDRKVKRVQSNASQIDVDVNRKFDEFQEEITKSPKKEQFNNKYQVNYQMNNKQQKQQLSNNNQTKNQLDSLDTNQRKKLVGFKLKNIKQESREDRSQGNSSSKVNQNSKSPLQISRTLINQLQSSKFVDSQKKSNVLEFPIEDQNNIFLNGGKSAIMINLQKDLEQRSNEQGKQQQQKSDKLNMDLSTEIIKLNDLINNFIIEKQDLKNIIHQNAQQLKNKLQEFSVQKGWLQSQAHTLQTKIKQLQKVNDIKIQILQSQTQLYKRQLRQKQAFFISQIQSLQEETKENKIQYDKLKNQYEKLKSLNNDSQDWIKIKNENEQMIKKLKQQNFILDQQKKQLQYHFNNLADELQDSKNQIKRLINENQLTKKSQIQNLENQKLNQQNDANNGLKIVQNQNLQHAQATIHQKQEINNLKNPHQVNLHQVNQSVIKDIQNLKNQNQGLKSQLKKQSTQLQQIKNNNSELNDQIMQLQNRMKQICDQYQIKIKQIQQRQNDKYAQIRNLTLLHEAQKDELSKQLQTIKFTLSQITKQNSQSPRQKEKSIKQKQTLKNQILLLNQQINSLKQQLKKQIQSNENQINKSKKQAKQIQPLKTSNTYLTKNNLQLIQKVNQLESQTKRLKYQNQQLNQQNHHQNQAKLKQQPIINNKTQQQQDSIISQLKQKIISLMKIITQLQEQIKNHHLENQQTKNHLNIQLKNKENLIKQQQNIKKINQNLIKQNQKLNQSNQSLKNDLNQLQKSIKQNHQPHDILNSRNQIKSQKIISRTSPINVLQKMLQKHKLQIIQLHKQLRNKNQQLKILKNQIMIEESLNYSQPESINTLSNTQQKSTIIMNQNTVSSNGTSTPNSSQINNLLQQVHDLRNILKNRQITYNSLLTEKDHQIKQLKQSLQITQKLLTEQQQNNLSNKPTSVNQNSDRKLSPQKNHKDYTRKNSQNKQILRYQSNNLNDSQQTLQKRQNTGERHELFEIHNFVKVYVKNSNASYIVTTNNEENPQFQFQIMKNQQQIQNDTQKVQRSIFLKNNHVKQKNPENNNKQFQSPLIESRTPPIIRQVSPVKTQLKTSQPPQRQRIKSLNASQNKQSLNNFYLQRIVPQYFGRKNHSLSVDNKKT